MGDWKARVGMRLVVWGIDWEETWGSWEGTGRVFRGPGAVEGNWDGAVES